MRNQARDHSHRPAVRVTLQTKLAHGRSLLWGLVELVALLRARRRADAE